MSIFVSSMYLFIDWTLTPEIKTSVHILWEPELWMAKKNHKILS